MYNSRKREASPDISSYDLQKSRQAASLRGEAAAEARMQALAAARAKNEAKAAAKKRAKEEAAAIQEARKKALEEQRMQQVAETIAARKNARLNGYANSTVPTTTTATLNGVEGTPIYDHPLKAKLAASNPRYKPIPVSIVKPVVETPEPPKPTFNHPLKARMASVQSAANAAAAANSSSSSRTTSIGRTGSRHASGSSSGVTYVVANNSQALARVEAARRKLQAKEAKESDKENFQKAAPKNNPSYLKSINKLIEKKLMTSNDRYGGLARQQALEDDMKARARANAKKNAETYSYLNSNSNNAGPSHDYGSSAGVTSVSVVRATYSFKPDPEGNDSSIRFANEDEIHTRNVSGQMGKSSRLSKAVIDKMVNYDDDGDRTSYEDSELGSLKSM